MIADDERGGLVTEQIEPPSPPQIDADASGLAATPSSKL
jgi:hypothetical protein